MTDGPDEKNARGHVRQSVFAERAWRGAREVRTRTHPCQENTYYFEKEMEGPCTTE